MWAETRHLKPCLPFLLSNYMYGSRWHKHAALLSDNYHEQHINSHLIVPTQIPKYPLTNKHYSFQCGPHAWLAEIPASNGNYWKTKSSLKTLSWEVSFWFLQTAQRMAMKLLMNLYHEGLVLRKLVSTAGSSWLTDSFYVALQSQYNQWLLCSRPRGGPGQSANKI